MQATSEIFDWLKPSPLWSGDAEELLHGDLFRPRLLQFESDQFIDDFLKIVKQSKLGSQELLADGVVKPPPGNVPATLYQPAHGVFYLVCASLCCRQAGFPDRVINRGQGDKVSFVVRKLMPDNSELGWCGEAKQKSWQSVPTPAASVAPTEELKPLMTADASDGRTLLFGYVPVASRETYAAGKDQLIPDPPTVNKDLRVQEFGSRFTGNFVAPPGSALPLQGKSPLEANLGANASSLELIVSLNLFLDLSEFFALYIPAVAGALGFSPDPKAPPFTGTTAAQDKLLKTLADQVLVQIDQPDGTKKPFSLADALKTISAKLADVQSALAQSQVPAGFADPYNLVTFVKNSGPDAMKTFTVNLNADVAGALPDELPAGQTAFKLPKYAGDDTYIIRLIYQRAACIPVQYWLSRRTDPFKLAGFFDPDAPARQVRIPLPGDLSIGSLRKFKKNVSFVMSDAMQRKMASITPDFLKDKGSDPGFGVAMICSFSIQIIFIIAFMLLIVFVFVLNIVFFWIAFFKICFPIPKKLAPK